MKEIVFMLEEQSAAELMKIFLPRILDNNIKLTFVTFQGKQDLEKKLGARLRGYINPDARFLIMRDQDSGDCQIIKDRLNQIASANTANKFCVRIVCRALESWHLAQLDAVEQGLAIKGLAKHQNKRNLRQPDNIGSPDRYLNELCKGTYTKVDGSREIARFLDPECDRSSSFKHFVSAIRCLAN